MLSVTLIVLFLSSLLAVAISFNDPEFAQLMYGSVATPLKNVFSEFTEYTKHSMTEVMIAVYIVTVIIAVIFVLRSNVSQLSRRGIKAIALCLTVPILIALTYGPYYAMPSSYGKIDKSIDSSDIENALFLLVDSLPDDAPNFNSTYVKTASEVEDMYGLMLHGAGDAQLKSPSYSVGAKSGVLTKLGVLSYYSPAFDQITLNNAVPNYMKPSLIAHEYAHHLGFKSEGVSNYLAFIACHSSKDSYISYSGDMLAIELLLSSVKSSEMYTTVYNMLPEYALNDLKAWNDFHHGMNGGIYELGKSFNKIHRSATSSGDYNDAVALITFYLTHGISPLSVVSK